MQVGKREGGDVFAAATEIEGERVGTRPESGSPRGSWRRPASARAGTSARDANSTAIDGTGLPSIRNVNGQSSHHVVEIGIHIESAYVGLLAHCYSLRRRGSNRLIAALNLAQHHLAGGEAAARARRKSRSKPRMRAPSGSSPNGISDCSIEVRENDIQTHYFAPPSTIAVRTRPISRVQVRVGDPLKGGVR